MNELSNKSSLKSSVSQCNKAKTTVMRFLFLKLVKNLAVTFCTNCPHLGLCGFSSFLCIYVFHFLWSSEQWKYYSNHFNWTWLAGKKCFWGTPGNSQTSRPWISQFGHFGAFNVQITLRNIKEISINSRLWCHRLVKNGQWHSDFMSYVIIVTNWAACIWKRF